MTFPVANHEKKPIAIDIGGGLGNHMFQYAHALSLSLDHQLTPRICLDYLPHTRVHNGYQLDQIFEISPKLIDSREMTETFHWLGELKNRRWIGKSPLITRLFRSAVFERKFAYHKHKLRPDRVPGFILRGSWQSELYFAHNSAAVRAAFRFRPNDLIDKGMSAIGTGDNTVAIHVRGGDYTTPRATTVYVQLGRSYYAEAVAHIRRTVRNPKFFVFTNDPDILAERLPEGLDYTLVEGHQNSDAFVEMAMMSKCAHIITANSTFSWWSAWLNSRAGAQIVAPKAWFGPAKNHYDASYLVPKRWVRA